MKKFVFLLLFVLCFCFSYGQILDSICNSFHSKPTFFFSFAQHNSFVSSEPANISGLRAGLEYNNTVRLGIGYSWLGSQIVDLIQINDDAGQYATNGELKFRYWNTSFEYVFYKRDPWQFTFPLQAGIGGAHYEYLRRTDKIRLKTTNYLVIPVEPSITAQYNILDWIGVVGGVGYRFTLNSTKELKKDFDSPIYVLKLKFFFDAILKDLLSNEAPKGEGK